jgi:hypothetical protein
MPETPSQISLVREDYRASNPGRGNLLANTPNCSRATCGSHSGETSSSSHQASRAVPPWRAVRRLSLQWAFCRSLMQGSQHIINCNQSLHHHSLRHRLQTLQMVLISLIDLLDQPTINVFSPPPDLSRHEQNGIPFWIKRRHTPPSALNRSSFMSVYFESSSVSTSGRPRAERRHASATTQEGSKLGGT